MHRSIPLLFALLLSPSSAHAQSDSGHVVDLFVRSGYADLSLNAIRAERFDDLTPLGSVGRGKTLPYPNGSILLGLEIRRTQPETELAFGFVYRSLSASGRYEDSFYRATVRSTVSHYAIYVTSGWAIVRTRGMRVYAHASPAFEITINRITSHLGMDNAVGVWRESTFEKKRRAYGFGIGLSMGVAVPVAGKLSMAFEAGYYSDTVMPGYRTRLASLEGPPLQTSGLTVSVLVGWRLTK